MFYSSRRPIMVFLMLTNIVNSAFIDQNNKYIDCQCDSTCYYKTKTCTDSMNCYCREKFSLQKSITHSNSTMRQAKSQYIWSCPCYQCIPKWEGRIASRISIRKHDIQILPSNIFRHRFRSKDDKSLEIIKTLDLSNNKIVEIQSGAFFGLGSLEWLQLSNNGFEIVPESAFADIPTLKNLNMSQNLIQNLTVGQFIELPLLEYLDLQNCKISDIAPSAFIGLIFLKKLLIGGNQLTILKENTFNGLDSLKALDLSANQLHTLEIGVLVGMPFLDFVDFTSNPFNFGAAGVWENIFGHSEFRTGITEETKDRNVSAIVSDLELSIIKNNNYPCNCLNDGSSCLGVWSIDERDLKLKCVNIQTNVFRTVEFVTTNVANVNVADYDKTLVVPLDEDLP